MALKDLIRKILDDLKDSKTNYTAEEEPILITRFGRQFEQAFLGYTLSDESNLYFAPDEYLSFVESLEEMKRIQPIGYNPSNPSEGCNKEFFEAVNKFLKIIDRYNPEKDGYTDDLKYYISVGTKMDFWHGADAVFTWHDVVVTVDLTVDPEKEVKADFRIMPDEVESGEVYTKIALGIALLLIQKQLKKICGYNFTNVTPGST